MEGKNGFTSYFYVFKEGINLRVKGYRVGLRGTYLGRSGMSKGMEKSDIILFNSKCYIF